MSVQQQIDYSHELDIVARMLRPGGIPLGDSFGWEQPAEDEMAYLGTVEIECLDRSVGIADITRWKWLQRYIRNCARKDDTYEKWDDSVKLNASELTCEVEYPLAKMSPYERARYRLRVLLVNSQGILEGDAHDWALQVSRDQCETYWCKKDAHRGEWSDDNCPDELSPVMSLLFAVKIDLEPWSRAYEVDCCEELPETPPLAWVKETGATARLFGLTADDLKYEDADELDSAVAYALYALIEGRPTTWSKELYLTDALRLNLPTFEACQERLANCLATLPELADYVDETRQATDLTAMNEVLHRLYEEAPKRGIWLIA